MGRGAEGGGREPLKTLKRFPFRVVRVFSGSGCNGPLFRDVQDRIGELADVLPAGNGVEASAARVADEELGAIREDGYGMGAERHVHAHAEGGIVVAQRLLKFFEMGNRFPEQLRVKAPPRFREALLRGITGYNFHLDAEAPLRNSSTDSKGQQRFLAWQKVAVGRR